MWRGSTWANINYIFIEALNRIGRNDLAHQLRDETLALIMKNEGIYEFYDSESGEPGEQAAPMFGWTAAVFIDLVLRVSKNLENL
jgi:glycogen debranching enzyme